MALTCGDTTNIKIARKLPLADERALWSREVMS
jgi:hypothetical protein